MAAGEELSTFRLARRQGRWSLKPLLGAMAPSPVQAFLAHLSRDPRLQAQVQASVTADEVALLAQQLGYAVSGSDLLLLSGRSVDGVRVTRVDHPGEYPGRYY
ncbi:Nif11-like leader peptide family natural product precursor [Synechococcus sp. W2B2]|uniref:Nif11-like leader peptide family natural product precursor n=1 Tax=Synechococcus sp. W2B2 TaxID=3392296 RepID=UPI00006B0BDE|nr:hypothetical protein WH7805_01237 [Synechococcus sp. WH 7805]